MAGLVSFIFSSVAGGAGGGGVPGFVNTGGKTAPYSLERLHALYDELLSYRSSDLRSAERGASIVETVRAITEALVWGEQNDSRFFDFFCEKSMLHSFINVLCHAERVKPVKVQLLQTLSMLVQNIKRQQSLYFLFSGNQVNNLIRVPMDFSDEDILAYYMTLLKSLAMRLDDETIKFFFIPHTKEFPLYLEAVKFFNHRDQMVRATVRTITLQVYKIQHEQMRAFVLQHAEEAYFSDVALHLRDLWLAFNAAAVSKDATALQHENDLQQDLLMYLADVFDQGVAPLNKVLAERLLDRAVVPLLLLSLESQPSHSPVPSPASDRARLEPRVALFLVRQVLDTIRWPQLSQPLAGALLHHKVPSSILDFMPPDAPSQFHATFVGFLKGVDDAALMCAAGILDTVLQSRQAFPPSFLEAARVVPCQLVASRAKRCPPLVADHNLDVPHAVLYALRRPGLWREDAFRILLLLITEMFLDPLVLNFAEIRNTAEGCVRMAACGAASEVVDLLTDRGPHAAGRQPSDEPSGELLDLFMEEWRERAAPAPRLSNLCLDAWRLLAEPEPVGDERPPPREYARRMVRAFVKLRRLLHDLEEGRPEEPSALARLSVSPFPWANWTLACTEVRDVVLEAADGRGGERRAQKRRAVAAETAEREAALLEVSPDGLSAFQEGAVVELGTLEGLPCLVAGTSDGGERLLVRHGSHLVLVRLQGPGSTRACVTTLWPLQQVQCLVERGDPRTLQLFLQAVAPGRPPGEAVEVRGAGFRSTNFGMALTFLDCESCHAAVVRLQRGRKEVRSQLLERVVGFLEVWRDEQHAYNTRREP